MEANKKVWVTFLIFEDWFFHLFIFEVERYCSEKNIEFKILFIVDNAPPYGHPHYLDDFYPNMDIVYLPLNTTAP